MPRQRKRKKPLRRKYVPRLERLETRETPANFTGVTIAEHGIATHRTVVADLVLDGFNDILTVALNSTQIKVQVNDGNGFFLAANTITITTANGQEALDAAAGDFETNNAAQDFAVLVEGATQNQVQIWKGDGSGNFTLFGTHNAGTGADQLVGADFNGDTFVDLATASSTTGTITILINDTLGDFSAAPFLFSSGSKATNLTAADAQNDGDHDVIITNPDDNSIRVIRNDGTGNMVDQVISPVGSPVIKFIVDNLTIGDSLPDAAVTSGTQVLIFSSNSTGLFTAQGLPIETNAQTGPLTSADYDGDNARDLAVIVNVMQGGNTIPTFRIFKNDAGAFTAVEDAPIVGSVITTAVSARLDQDSRIDLAAGASTVPGTYVLRNVPDEVSGFAVTTSGGVTVGVPFTVTVSARRFNNTVMTTYAGQVNLTSSDPTNANLGSLTFTAADQGEKTLQVTLNTAGNITITARDNANPNIAGSTNVQVVQVQGSLPADYRPLSDPEFRADVVGATALAFGDYGPAEGKLTLLVFDRDLVHTVGGSGDKDDRPRDIQVGNEPTDMITAPFSRGGTRKNEIAVANSGDGTITIISDVVIAENKHASGVPAPDTKTIQVGGTPRALQAGHFRSTDLMDLAVTNTATNAVNILLNQDTADRDFTAGANINVGRNPTALVAAPLLGGILDDLAIVNQDDNTITVLANRGNAAFAQVALLNTGVQPRDLIAADLDRDGHQDIAVANRNSNTVGIYYGNGQGGFTAAQVFNVGANPTKLDFGDFDDNGFPDIIVANSGASSLSLLLNAGSRQYFPAQEYVVGASPIDLTVEGRDIPDAFPDVIVLLADGSVDSLKGRGVNHVHYAPLADLNGGAVNQNDNTFQPSPVAPYSALNPVSGQVLIFYIDPANQQIHRIRSDAQGSFVPPDGSVSNRQTKFLESLQRRGNQLVLTARDLNNVSFEVVLDAMTGNPL